VSQSPSPSLQRLLESYEAQYVAQNKTSRELFERAKRSLAGGVTGNMKLMRPYPHPLFFTDARGSKVYDVDGHEYIDTITGAGTQILGHCHPAIVEAIKQQVDRAIMTIYPTELEPALATSWATVSSLALIVRCEGRVPFAITETGVWA